MRQRQNKADLIGTGQCPGILVNPTLQYHIRECRVMLSAVQVEFNKAALSLSDALSSDQRQSALNRLLKVRPALHSFLLRQG